MLRDGVARIACNAALQIEIALQALQVGAQIGSGLIPEIAVLFEKLADDVVQPLGKLGIELGWRDRHSRQYFLKKNRLRDASESRNSGAELVEHGAQGE